VASYYYDAQAAGTGTGADWTNAFTTMAAALAAATADGDIIYAASDSVEQLAADTTYTFLNNVRVISVDATSGTPPTTLQTQEAGGGYIGHLASARSIIVGGAFKLYFYGIEFAVTGSDLFRSANTDGQHTELEECHVRLGGSGATFDLGTTGTESNRYTRMRGGKATFGNANNQIRHFGAADFEGITLAGTAPTTLIASATGGRSGNLLKMEGCDLSLVTGTLVAVNTVEPSEVRFINCKLGSGVTPLNSTGNNNLAFTRVWIFDCSSGDEHYHLQYHDAFGSLTVDTGIYANDGAQYDGTNRCSWKIVTSGLCSYYTPFVSPWFDVYSAAVSAKTPSIEILRDGSTTAYQDDEVWGEWAAKVTAGSTRSTMLNCRKPLLDASPNNITAGVGTSAWTGEAGSAWSGKLEPSSTITPAEIGHIRGRVCVGEPSITVYVDPQTRLA
jgi:hypothetical protein